MSAKPPKTPGRIPLRIGWVFFWISALSIPLSFKYPIPRDPSVNALFRSPSLVALAGTLGIMIGTNFFTLVALVFGAIAGPMRKHPDAKTLLVWSGVLFAAVALRKLIP